jgi:hypothetical protein
MIVSVALGTREMTRRAGAASRTISPASSVTSIAEARGLLRPFVAATRGERRERNDGKSERNCVTRRS